MKKCSFHNCSNEQNQFIKCSNCKIFYCSSLCKKSHYKIHKKSCTFIPSPQQKGNGDFLHLPTWQL